jgi:hypothetical protein
MKKVEKNITDALNIEFKPSCKEIVEEQLETEIVPYEAENEEISDQDKDYILARRVLRNLITKGNKAIDEITDIAKMNESARGYEVVATLIKTVADTTKDLYNVQKMKKDLIGPSPDSDPRKKTDEANITVEQAVFVGSTAELLTAIKEKKDQLEQ